MEDKIQILSHLMTMKKRKRKKVTKRRRASAMPLGQQPKAEVGVEV